MRQGRPGTLQCAMVYCHRSEEHTSELQSHSDLHSFPTRRSSDLKLFAEVVENIDMKPVEGVYATGAPWHVAMRYGVLPQVLPTFVSYALLRFEINVRGARSEE